MRNNQGVCSSWGLWGADSSTQRAVAVTEGPLGISTFATATLLPLPHHHHHYYHHHHHYHYHYYHCCTSHLTCPDLTCSSLHPSCSQYLPYIWNWTGSTSVLQLKCIHLISYVFQYCFELNGGIMKYCFLAQYYIVMPQLILPTVVIYEWGSYVPNWHWWVGGYCWFWQSDYWPRDFVSTMIRADWA